jgi:DnaD/phage-associated family protein
LDKPSLEALLDQLEDIGGLELFGPEGLALLLALWRKSMKLAWARTFVMTNTELIYKAGFKNRESLNKCRHKLTQAGLIHYKPPARGKADGTYTLEFDLISAIQKRVVKEPVSQIDNSTDNIKVVKEVVSVADNFADNFPDRLADNFADNSPDNFPDTIERKKEGMQEGRIDARACIQNPWDTLKQEFEQMFRVTMKQHHYDMVNSYIDDGMDIEVILLALEDARNNAAEYPKYLWTVLNNWIDRGIRTIDDYRRHMQAQSEIAAGKEQVSPAKQGGRQNARNSSHSPTTSRKSNVVSITGNQVGWIGRPAEDI